jgi:hypothetical protein
LKKECVFVWCISVESRTFAISKEKVAEWEIQEKTIPTNLTLRPEVSGNSDANIGFFLSNKQIFFEKIL